MYGCFCSEGKMLTMLRRKRCIICLLPLLGVMLLIFGFFPGETINYGTLISSSRNIVETFQWRVAVDDERVRMLKPVSDESGIIQNMHPYISEFAPLRLGTKIQEGHKSKVPTELYKLFNREVSLDSGVNDVSLFGSKIPNKSVGVALSSRRALDNSSEDLESQYFHAVKPVIEPTLPRHNKIHVLIVTNRRSGSSFLGQFFNQHPGLFFQFEPLKLTEWKKEFYPDRSEYLRHLVKCEFDSTPYLVEFYANEPLHRSSSKVMTSPPLCNVSFPGQITIKTVTECQPMEKVPLMRVCHTKQYQAIKLIRLYSISSLKPLAFDPDINLKIIHLVRDPRGTHFSRSKLRGSNVSLKLGASLDHDISYLCRRINRNLDFIRSQPSWLRGKYKLVRFEDIAYHPQELADEIYDFTGMGQLPEEVLAWIQNNTKGWVKERERLSKGMYYSTSRNASQVSEAWRYEVPFQVVLRMQTFCRETLRDLGYREVDTEQELLDKSKSLVSQLPSQILT